VKPSGQLLLSELARYAVRLDDELAGRWHVPMGRAGVSIVTSARPKLVILLKSYGEELRPRSPTWLEVSRADAVVALVEQSLDPLRLGKAALPLVVGLCAHCRCVSISPGSPAETIRLIERLFREASSQTAVPSEVITTNTDNAGAFLIPADVVSARICDEMVVQRLETGATVALNPSAAELWSAAVTRGHDPRRSGPPGAAFFAQLAESGFVHSGPARPRQSDLDRDE
jgi:hypothetical protein